MGAGNDYGEGGETAGIAGRGAGPVGIEEMIARVCRRR